MPRTGNWRCDLDPHICTDLRLAIANHDNNQHSYNENMRIELALREGDRLAVLSAGAYGMTMASNYNSRPRAA